MTSSLMKTTCRVLVTSLLAFSFTTARAGLIGAEQAVPANAAADRVAVMDVLSRSEASAQLQALGVDPALARERVASMTDTEVQALAQDIRTAPAGAWSGGVVLAVVIIAAAVWYFAYRK
ncbi:MULTISPECIES: PA2779 family protein [Ramlibacter]|uniref:PA2779 family protein n=1 Tax=Ramlibacter aquaticus TaxID=2780094 RepID=A0ABR9SA94_9BURK|nr:MULTISPECIES: PA2779 family protein [Ramlibacter]MBE7939007.1 PA2779 family protein [Ramlibacter aquaticus]